MAFSIVQHATNDGTGTTVSVSCSATTAGNLLVAFIGASTNPSGTNSFATVPTGWTQIGSTVDDLSYIEITGGAFYLANCSGGSTSFSWTLGSTPSHWDIMLLEISGAATVSPLDVSNVSNAKTLHTSDSTSITTTANGDVILGFGIWDNLPVATTAFIDGTGYTLIQTFSDTPGWETLHAAYQTQTSAGSISYAPSWTGSADDILWIVAFKAAAGGGGVTHVRIMDGYGGVFS